MYVSHAIHAREGSELACLRHAAEGPGDLGDKKESNHLIEVGREVGSRISLHMEGTRYYTEYTNRRLAANKQTNTKFTAGQMAQHMQKVQSPYHLTARLWLPCSVLCQVICNICMARLCPSDPPRLCQGSAKIVAKQPGLPG